jgi:hypothetical protein
MIIALPVRDALPRESRDELMMEEIYVGYGPHDMFWDWLDRADSLTALLIKKPLTGNLAFLMGQALDCYLNGLHAACVVMCRAVIEERLKQVFGDVKWNSDERKYFRNLENL